MSVVRRGNERIAAQYVIDVASGGLQTPGYQRGAAVGQAFAGIAVLAVIGLGAYQLLRPGPGCRSARRRSGRFAAVGIVAHWHPARFVVSQRSGKDIARTP